MKKTNVLQRLATAIALMVVVALVAVACGGDDPTPVPTRAPAATTAPTAVPPTATTEAMVEKELTTVKVGLPTPPSVGNMWFDLAKAKGWDREFGIDLQIERATGGGAVTALVVGGAVHIGGGVPDSLLNAVAQGEDLVSIRKLHPPTKVFPVFFALGRKDAGINSWADLEGKKFGILGPGSATKFSTDLMLFANGVDPDSVEYVSLGGIGAYVEALKSKSVDAVGSWLGPNQTVFKPDTELWNNLTVLPADLYQGDVYLAKRSWVEANEEAVIGFNMMLAKTLTYYVTYPELAVDFGQANIPEVAATDREVGINTVKTNRPARSLDGFINPADIEEYIPLAQQAGLISDELDPSSIDVYNIFLNKYAEEAINRLYASAEEQDGLPTIKIGLPTPPSVGNMWFDLAKVKNWDNEFGFNLEIERATGGGAVTALVVGGAVDIGGGVPDSLLNAVAQGEDLVSIRKLHPPTKVFPVFFALGRKDAGINSWADLEGKKFGILGPGSATKFSTDLMLFANGVDPDSVEYVSLGGIGAYVEALKSKSVDAVGSWLGPNQTVFKPDTELWNNLTVLPADLYQGDVYLAKRSWVEANEEAVIGFNMMLAKTLTYYVTYPELAVDFGQANIPEVAATDREVGINTVKTNRPARSLDGFINPADIEEYIPLAQQAGLISDELDPAAIDVYDIFLNTHAEQAIEEIYAAYEG